LETLDKLIVEEIYLPEQIFNMDETCLFWKRMPEGLMSIMRSSQCQVSRFVYVHSDIHTMMKSPNDAFIRSYPRREATHDSSS
jgi:hypothetical protein